MVLEFRLCGWGAKVAAGEGGWCGDFVESGGMAGAEREGASSGQRRWRCSVEHEGVGEFGA